jgi:hypothetical protein
MSYNGLNFYLIASFKIFIKMFAPILPIKVGLSVGKRGMFAKLGLAFSD